MAIMTGLNKAHSHYACIWWDMSATEETYTTSPPAGKARTLASLHANCTHSRPNKHLGSKYPPLLEIEPSQYVLDELHLLLRVADVLLCNLIHLADQLDQTQQLSMQVQNENGTTVTGMYEWTSLNQAQNLLVLQNLPDKLSDLFPEPHPHKIVQQNKLWLCFTYMSRWSNISIFYHCLLAELRLGFRVKCIHGGN